MKKNKFIIFTILLSSLSFGLERANIQTKSIVDTTVKYNAQNEKEAKEAFLTEHQIEQARNKEVNEKEQIKNITKLLKEHKQYLCPSVNDMLMSLSKSELKEFIESIKNSKSFNYHNNKNKKEYLQLMMELFIIKEHSRNDIVNIIDMSYKKECFDYKTLDKK